MFNKLIFPLKKIQSLRRKKFPEFYPIKQIDRLKIWKIFKRLIFVSQINKKQRESIKSPIHDWMKTLRAAGNDVWASTCIFVSKILTMRKVQNHEHHPSVVTGLKQTWKRYLHFSVSLFGGVLNNWSHSV